MLEKLKLYLQFGNRFCGTEHTNKNGIDLIIATELKKHKNELTIENSYEVSTIEQLIDKLPKKQHLHLIINNENVITKRADSDIKDSLKLVYNNFPNINLDDFYYEVTNQGKLQFISICRRAYADGLIEKYRQLGFSIVGFSLGNSLISNISEFIKTEGDISTSNALIARQENTLTDITKDDIIDFKEYNINGLTVSNTQLLSFTGALQPVLKTNNQSTNYENKKQHLLNDFKHARFFRLFLKFSAVLLLTILLINFFFFNHYYSQVNALQQTSLINQSTKEKVLTLKKAVNNNQKIVNDMLKSNASKSSFYSNIIIHSLPNSIILSELNYQPLEKRIKANKAIEITNHTIIVSGDSNSSNLFSKWLNKLDTFDWINSIETIAYSDISSSKSIFTIKIKINHE